MEFVNTENIEDHRRSYKRYCCQSTVVFSIQTGMQYWLDIRAHTACCTTELLFKQAIRWSDHQTACCSKNITSVWPKDHLSHLCSKVSEWLCVCGCVCVCVCTLLCSTVASWPSLPWSSWSKSVRVELESDWITAETGSTNQHSTWATIILR